jgi:mono/diheme cytochrome c family protein
VEVELTDLIRKKLSLFILLISMVLGQGCSHSSGEVSYLDDFPFSSEGRVHPQVLEHLHSEWIPSRYFDRGMHTEESQFRAVALSELVQRFHPEERWDAVLLSCHDDYQGVISIDDIWKYDLRLALELKLAENVQRPSWLNPMVVIVPDSKEAPHQERFMTANIRSLQFVRLTDYYAPLDDVALKSFNAHLGLQTFKDNCLFCHSLNGVGGNKGAALLEVYDFSIKGETPRFKKDFSAFHNKDNADKQDMEQFVRDQVMLDVITFLRELSRRI